MSKWKGTPVPNSGYVENVYVNTSLSKEEVLEIINGLFSILYPELPEYGFYMITCNQSQDTQYSINMYNYGDSIGYDLWIVENWTGRPIFAVNCNIQYELWGMSTVTFEGWNPDFDGVLKFNSNVGDMYDTYNANIANLFSITPFVKEEDKPKYDWLRELFINEAKPALKRHSGGKAPSYEETENEAGGITVSIGSKEE